MWYSWWNQNWQGKPQYSEKTCPSATLSTKNPILSDLGSSPGRRGGKPTTNRLSGGRPFRLILMQLLGLVPWQHACATHKRTFLTPLKHSGPSPLIFRNSVVFRVVLTLNGRNFVRRHGQHSVCNEDAACFLRVVPLHYTNCTRFMVSCLNMNGGSGMWRSKGMHLW
jgi:hypothetical protein